MAFCSEICREQSTTGQQWSESDPPENCHLTVKKLPMAILLKKITILVNFFEKNVKFLAIF